MKDLVYDLNAYKALHVYYAYYVNSLQMLASYKHITDVCIRIAANAFM